MKGPNRLAQMPIRMILVWTIVTISMAWTAYDWNGLRSAEHQIGTVVWLATVLVLCDFAFFGGAFLVAAALGRRVLAGTGGNPLLMVRAVIDYRATYVGLAGHANGSRLFQFGFILSWVGGTVSGLILTVGILIILPVSAWGLLVLPALDLIATLRWRASIASLLKAPEKD